MRIHSLLSFSLISASLIAMAQTPLPPVPSKAATKLIAHHRWDWTITDEQGHPLSDVLLVQPRFFVRSLYQSYPKWDALLLSQKLGLPLDPEPLRATLERTVYQNIEMYEIMASFRRVPLFDYDAQTWHKAPDGHFWSTLPVIDLDWESIGFLSIVFKPGYHPAVIYRDYAEALKTNTWASKVVLKPWPERQATLVKRPWVMENIRLQQAIQEERNKSSAKPLFGKDPFVVWEEKLGSLRDQALAAGEKRDAAWFELALAYTFRRTPTGYDASGQEDDLRNGRCYVALERAAEIAPEIRLIQARRDMRRFILSSPMGVIEKKQWPNGEPECRFDNFAKWTKKGLEQFFRTLAPYEDDPLLALRLSEMVESRGLFQSPKTNVDQFFQYRMKLWAILLRKSPSALWFTSADEWFRRYAFDAKGAYPLDYGLPQAPKK